jgi:hypothetical protein
MAFHGDESPLLAVACGDPVPDKSRATAQVGTTITLREMSGIMKAWEE